MWAMAITVSLGLAGYISFVDRDTTATLAWLVPAVTAIAAVVATILSRRAAAPPSRRYIVVETCFLLIPVLAMAGGVLVHPPPYHQFSDDDPDKFFSRKLRIGITGSLNGWSRNGSRGFDDQLASFIARHKKTDWTPVHVDGKNKITMLDEGTADTPPVDLIIATFTMNADRAGKVDMAGPYYIDTTGVWKNSTKSGVSPKIARVCQAKNTTGVGAAGQFSRQFLGEKFAGVYERETTLECLHDFQQSNSDTVYVASDWSILRTFNSNIPVTDGNDYPPAKKDAQGNVLDPGPPPSGVKLRADDRQEYGIAIKNGHPKICAALTDLINQFLSANDGFGDAYGENLQPFLGPAIHDWHNPQRAHDPGTPSTHACT